jgi:hypothetical protein
MAPAVRGYTHIYVYVRVYTPVYKYTLTSYILMHVFIKYNPTGELFSCDIKNTINAFGEGYYTYKW